IATRESLLGFTQSSRLLEVTTSVWTVHLVLVAWRTWAREEVFERHLDSMYSVAQESRLALADGFFDHAKDKGVERLKRQVFGGWKTGALLLGMEQREVNRSPLLHAHSPHISWSYGGSWQCRRSR
ncbi:hypothetical protein FOZ62_020542, partial [Perkinsus olseni]